MIRNGHSVMLLAIVAAVVVEGPAASAVTVQEPAATANAPAPSTSGASLDGRAAPAIKASVALCAIRSARR